MKQELLLNATIVITASTAILTFIDIMMSAKQKKWMTDKAELLWIWLDDQKAGKFIKLYLGENVQKVQILVVHIIFFLMILAVILSNFFSFRVFDENLSEIQIGFPRMYNFQYYVELVAIVISAIIITRYVHPYLIQRLKPTTSIWGYLVKVTIVWIFVCILYLLPTYLLAEGDILMTEKSKDEIIKSYGNQFYPISLHLLTAVFNSLLYAEYFLLYFMMAVS